MSSAAPCRGSVLVVDDEPDVRAVVARLLEREGYSVLTAPDGAAGCEVLAASPVEAVCLDLEMPGMGGMEVLARIRAAHRLLPVVILTVDTSVESVVGAIKAGAFDYLTKPIDPTQLATTIRNAIERYRMALRLVRLERDARGGLAGIIGASAPMREIYRQIDLVAATDIAVLILGESGTGKELVARAIHERSGRRDGAFVAVNCAAIPETLQESELFGHERGAFTGAVARRRGDFERADGGTLFLDEVAELGAGLQAKLLRVLQDKKFRRLGGEGEIRSDFRLIAATHRDLAELVREGRFREDLFFRIAVMELRLPPLRERGEDVLALAHAFVEQLGGNRRARRLAPETCRLLLRYDWPGNVRELRNVIQRALVMAPGETIGPDALPERLRAASTAEPAGAPVVPAPGGPERAVVARHRAGRILPTLNLEELERLAIAAALEEKGGNLQAAARTLGIGRTTLYRKLDRYGLRRGT